MQTNASPKTRDKHTNNAPRAATGETNRRSVLITGASSGLGAAMHQTFAQRGFDVIGTSRSGGAYEQLDVRDMHSVDALRDRLDVTPDVLILNAGFGVAGPVETTSVDDATAQMDTNVIGVHRMVTAFLPAMRTRGSGTIIIVGSIASRLAVPFQALYCASKAAVALYAESLAMELKDHGIKVRLVEPGDHKTGFAKARAHSDTADDPYAPRSRRALGIIEQNENNGNSASDFATKVADTVAKTSAPFRLTVASLGEKLVLFASRFAPMNLKLFTLRRIFGMA